MVSALHSVPRAAGPSSRYQRRGRHEGVCRLPVGLVTLTGYGRQARAVQDGQRIFVRGRTYEAGRRDHDNSINCLVTSTNFFETLNIPVVRGRGFSPRDVINEAAARKYFPNEEPIGQKVGARIENSGQLEIVGVLRDTKYNSVREPAPPTMYVPYLQARVGSAMIGGRTAGDPASVTGGVREAVRQIDAGLPMMDVSTQHEQVEKRFDEERLFAQAYTLFGSLALLVASMVLFGLMSYTVSRRTDEGPYPHGARRPARGGDSPGAHRIDDAGGDWGRAGGRHRHPRRTLRLDPALRRGTNRRPDHCHGHRADGGPLGGRRLSARAPRLPRRSDGGAQIRLSGERARQNSRLCPPGRREKAQDGRTQGTDGDALEWRRPGGGSSEARAPSIGP